MKYEFDRGELKKLLKNTKDKYNSNDISKYEYELIETIINTLNNGSINHFKVNKCTNEKVKKSIAGIKEELGIDTIESILSACESILKIAPGFKGCNATHKHTCDDMVINVLRFYNQYDENNFQTLIKKIFTTNCHLEIVSDSHRNQKKYESSAVVLPYYNLDYVRIVKENKIYDYAALCHEFRHILDANCVNKTLMEFNGLREINPIYMELLYGKNQVEQNPLYAQGVKGRIEFFQYAAKYVQNYLVLLLTTGDTNHLNIDMLEEIFEIKNKKQLEEIKSALVDGSIYDKITYVLGFVSGIKLCNIAEQDLKAAKEMTNKVCDMAIKEKFIPDNLTNVLGEEFTNYENFENDYKTYIKK